MIKRKGNVILEMTVVMLVFMVMIATTITPVSSPVPTANDNLVKDQRMMIDTALQLWYSSHGATYPDNLQILQDMNFISNNIDLTKFDYAVNTDNTGYHLTANLSTGTSKSVESTF